MARLRILKKGTIIEDILDGVLDPVPLFENKYEEVICKNKISNSLFYSLDENKRKSLSLLKNDLTLTLPLKDGRIIIIKISSGILTDWASVPKLLQLFADTNDRRIRLGSLAHDCFYYKKCDSVTFREVQLIFRDLIILSGARRTWAGKYWLPTRLFSRSLYNDDTLLDMLMQKFITYEVKYATGMVK